MARCFVELFKNVEELDAVLLLLLLLKVYLVVLVETFLSLFRIQELSLCVFPRLFRLKLAFIDFTGPALSVTH